MRLKQPVWFGFVIFVILLAVTVGCSKGGDLQASASPSEQGASSSPSVSALSSPSLAPFPLPSAAPASKAPASQAPAGIDPDKFIPAVESYISGLNSEKSDIGHLTVKISVTYIIGFVDITFTDLTSWSRFNDSDKKEYITALGKALDTIAGNNTYPGTLPKVGTDTVLFSPSGEQLAERTSLGIVFLK